MTANDINGTALAVNDNVLVLFGTVGSIDSATANRVMLRLPGGNLMYCDSQRLEKMASTSIAATIAAAVATELVTYVESTRAINTTAPLTGGGDLTADRTLAISDFTGDSGLGGANGAVPAPAAGDAIKFLKGDGTWASPAGAGEIAVSSLAPVSDVSIAASYSAVIPRRLTVASGKKVSLASGARLRIL